MSEILSLTLINNDNIRYYCHILKQISSTDTILNPNKQVNPINTKVENKPNIVMDLTFKTIEKNKNASKTAHSEKTSRQQCEKETQTAVETIDLTDTDTSEDVVEVKIERAKQLSFLNKQRFLRNMKKAGVPLAGELNLLGELLDETNMVTTPPVTISPEPGDMEPRPTEEVQNLPRPDFSEHFEQPANQNARQSHQQNATETDCNNNIGAMENSDSELEEPLEDISELLETPLEYSDISSASTPEPANQAEASCTDGNNIGVQEVGQSPECATAPALIPNEPLLPAWRSDFSNLFDNLPHERGPAQMTNNFRSFYASDVHVSPDPPSGAAFSTSQLRRSRTNDFMPSEVSPNRPAVAHQGMHFKPHSAAEPFNNMDIDMSSRHYNAPVTPAAHHGGYPARSYSMQYQTAGAAEVDPMAMYRAAPVRPAPVPVNRQATHPYSTHFSGSPDLPASNTAAYEEPIRTRWSLDAERFDAYRGGFARPDASADRAFSTFYGSEPTVCAQPRPQIPRYLPPGVQTYNHSRYRNQGMIPPNRVATQISEPETYRPFSRMPIFPTRESSSGVPISSAHSRLPQQQLPGTNTYNMASARFQPQVTTPLKPASGFAVPSGEAPRCATRRIDRRSSVAEASFVASAPVPAYITPARPARPDPPPSRACPPMLPIRRMPGSVSEYAAPPAPSRPDPLPPHVSRSYSMMAMPGAMGQQSASHPAHRNNIVPEMVTPEMPTRPAPTAARRARSYSMQYTPGSVNAVTTCNICHRICKTPAGLKIHMSKCRRENPYGSAL